jgi:hypothetical protein
MSHFPRSSQLTNLDHLSTLSDLFTGMIVSVSPLASGATSYVLVDDTGVNLGNRRRWLGHSSEVTPSETLRVGDRVRFLPGPKRGKGKLARAYSISKFPADEKTKTSQAPAGK